VLIVGSVGDWMNWMRRLEEGCVEGACETRERNVSQRFQRKFSGSLVVGSVGELQVVRVVYRASMAMAVERGFDWEMRRC
jgi:hypothetical protein